MMTRFIQSLLVKRHLSQHRVLFIVRTYIGFLCFVLLAHITLLFPGVHVSRKMMTILAVPIGILVLATVVASFYILQMVMKQFHSIVVPIRKLSYFLRGLNNPSFAVPLPKVDQEATQEVYDLYQSIEQLREMLHDSFQVNRLMFDLASESLNV